MSKVDLKLDWCSHAAAKYAVEHWHYSKTMPAGKLVTIGAWEDAQFIGCVIFGHGATYTIGDSYELKQTECCELVRVCLCGHSAPTGKVVSIAIRILKRQSNGLRLIVSYADSKEGHLIYQATNWVYVGGSNDSWIRVNGQLRHRRSLTSKYGTNSLDWIIAHIDPNAQRVNMPTKYKYLYPLDNAMRKQIEPLRKPYPKRDIRGLGEIDNAPDSNQETGGASPTSPLCSPVRIESGAGAE